MRIAGLIGCVLVLSFSSILPAQTTQPTRSEAAAPKAAPSINFRDTALVDAIEYFRDITKLNIVVEWKALEDVGVSKDTPISINLKRVKIRVALKATLESAAPGLLSYYIDDGVVHITTMARADAKMVTRVYPIQDLLHEIPDFKDTGNDNNNETGTDITIGGGTGGGAGGGAGGGNLFGGGGAGNETNNERTTKKERAQNIIDLIQSTIRPEVWEPNGGKARIRHLNGNLVITAPLSVHQQIGIGY